MIDDEAKLPNRSQEHQELAVHLYVLFNSCYSKLFYRPLYFWPISTGAVIIKPLKVNGFQFRNLSRPRSAPWEYFIVYVNDFRPV